MSVPKVFWILIYNGIGLLVPTAAIVIATRSFPSTDVGAWLLFSTIIVFTSKIRDALIQASMIVQGSTEDTYKSSVKVGLVLSIWMEVIFCLIIIILGLTNVSKILTPFFLNYPLYGIGMALYTWQITTHQINQQVKKIFFSSLAYFVCSMLGFLLVVITHTTDISKLIMVQGIGYLGGAIAGIIVLPLRSIWSADSPRKVYIAFFHFGKFGLFRDIFGTVSARIGIIFTASWLTLTDTAILGIVQRISILLQMPIIASQMIFFPVACKLAEQKQYQKLRELYDDNMARTFAILLPFGCALIVFSNPILAMLGKETYTGAAPLLSITVASVAILSPFGLAFGSVTNAVGKPQLSAKVVTINAILNIALGAVLTYSIGLKGAILAPMISEVVGFLWARQILRRETGIVSEKCFTLIPFIVRRWLTTLRSAINLFVVKPRQKL